MSIDIYQSHQTDASKLIKQSSPLNSNLESPALKPQRGATSIQITSLKTMKRGSLSFLKPSNESQKKKKSKELDSAVKPLFNKFNDLLKTSLEKSRREKRLRVGFHYADEFDDLIRPSGESYQNTLQNFKAKINILQPRMKIIMHQEFDAAHRTKPTNQEVKQGSSYSHHLKVWKNR